MIKREVELVDVTYEEGKNAAVVMQALFDKYHITEEDRDLFWKSTQMALTYALLAAGRIPGTNDGPENGRAPRKTKRKK